MTVQHKLLTDYIFKDPSVLERMLRHPSLPFVSPSFYQRCEFLGDRVLALVVSDYLLTKYPQDNEGILSKKLSNLVRREALAAVGEKINLGEAIQIAESEELSGGRHNISILGDGCEALIGAMYLDGGLDPVRTFILEAWKFLFVEIDNEDADILDAKTTLQELLQKKGQGLPQYSIVKITGPNHAPFFTVQVKAHGYPLEIGEGHSKRQAEQDAAAKMVTRLNSQKKDLK